MLSGASVSDQPYPRADLVLRQVRRRLVPFAFLCYVAAYIDRVNIGFAATELQRDLGLTAWQSGFGAGLFFLGYCLLEIPSNLLLEKVGARRWITRIMIGWGLISMATMFSIPIEANKSLNANTNTFDIAWYPMRENKKKLKNM